MKCIYIVYCGNAVYRTATRKDATDIAKHRNLMSGCYTVVKGVPRICVPQHLLGWETSQELAKWINTSEFAETLLTIKEKKITS